LKKARPQALTAAKRYDLIGKAKPKRLFKTYLSVQKKERGKWPKSLSQKTSRREKSSEKQGIASFQPLSSYSDLARV